jgi:hypothetical protein
MITNNLGRSDQKDCEWQRELAEALLRKFEARPQLQGGLEGICRLLLIADAYRVPLLRDHCLHRLAARYTDLARRVAPQQEQILFSQFLLAVAPQVPFPTVLPLFSRYVPAIFPV